MLGITFLKFLTFASSKLFCCVLTLQALGPPQCLDLAPGFAERDIANHEPQPLSLFGATLSSDTPLTFAYVLDDDDVRQFASSNSLLQQFARAKN